MQVVIQCDLGTAVPSHHCERHIAIPQAMLACDQADNLLALCVGVGQQGSLDNVWQGHQIVVQQQLHPRKTAVTQGVESIMKADTELVEYSPDHQAG